MACAYFVSDIHLHDSREPRAKTLIAFLDRLMSDLKSEASSKPTHLFLVGDIFDFWIGNHSYFREKFEPIVSRIRELVLKGVQVHYFEGNHDLHLEDFWSKDLGAIVHTADTYVLIDGVTVRIEHGDLIDPDDQGYIFLRWFLRTPVLRSLALNLPSKVVTKIGETASQASRKRSNTRRVSAEERMKNLIRIHAQKAHQKMPFDLFISGHLHIDEDSFFTSGEKKIRYVNLGSWFEKPRAFMLAGNRAEFIDLSES